MWPESVPLCVSSSFPLHHTETRLTTSEGFINTFSRSSDSLWLCPRCCTSCNPARTHVTLQHLQTHTYNLFIRQTDTPSLPQHMHAELHCSSADCGRAASVCSLFGWAGVGGGDLEVGQGFQKTSAAPSQELLSCLGSLPLDNCLSLQTHILQNPPAGAKSYLGRTHRCTEMHLQERQRHLNALRFSSFMVKPLRAELEN